jgi:hypothetical protein
MYRAHVAACDGRVAEEQVSERVWRGRGTCNPAGRGGRAGGRATVEAKRKDDTSHVAAPPRIGARFRLEIKVGSAAGGQWSGRARHHRRRKHDGRA